MDSVIPLIAVSIGLVFASFTDCTRFKVYNMLTFPLFFTGLAYGFWAGGWVGVGFALLGAVTAFGILLIPYLMGGLGAGDVKFLMGIGCWLGAETVLGAVLIGCVMIFVYYLLIIARRQGVAGIRQQVQLMFYRLSCFGRYLTLDDQFETVQSAANSADSSNRGRLIPFSAMMSLGVVITLVISKVVQLSSTG